MPAVEQAGPGRAAARDVGPGRPVVGPAGWITLAYAGLSAAWIAWSDLIVSSAATSAQDQTTWSIAKGMGFVGVTSALLYLGIRWSVTRAHRLQAQLETARRLASLGTLVAGVGHEVKNPLTASLAAVGLAREDVQRILDRLASGQVLEREAIARELRGVAELLADAEAGGERAARVVQDFTAFGRSDGARVRARLADVVSASMRWLPTAVAGAAEIRVETGDAPDVLASPGQLQQVVVNLVTNAAKAIPAGRRGKIVIRTGRAGPRAACLEIVDDGVGMAPEVAARAFEPFFTTREVGEGTGLGLAIAHAIAASHGGAIEVTSAPGVGTTFRVTLPAAPATPDRP